METLSVQKGITKESVALALEVSIAAAVSRQLEMPSSGEEGAVEVKIDRNSGVFDITKLIPKDPDAVTSVAEVRELPEEEVVKEKVPNFTFGRVAIQAAKQSILQKVREAEREQMAEDYLPSLHKLFVGEVKRITRTRDIIVFLNNRVEAILPHENYLAQDNYEIGDEISAVLMEIDPSRPYNQLVLSRTSEQMLKALFEREVPEISQQIVEICAIARLPGVRSKVAIRPKDHRIDAMSACIGIQGRRVEEVQRELKGEKVDILEWSDSPEALVRNVLGNANILSVLVHPSSHTIDVAVPDDDLAETIGKDGQNVNLAKMLIGWEINILSKQEVAKRQEEEMDSLRESFKEILDADSELVDDLVKNGFSSIKQLAYAPTDKFLRLEGFDEDLANEIRNRALEHVLSQALTEEEGEGEELAGEEQTIDLRDLMSLRGMTEELAYELSARQISRISDLAEYSVDELEELVPGIDKDLSAEIILEAKKIHQAG